MRNRFSKIYVLIYYHKKLLILFLKIFIVKVLNF